MWEDLGRLAYLNAAIKETLRLSSPTAMGSFRVTTRDTRVCGRVVPAGVTVLLPPHVVDGSARNYGADAASFRPERWLQVDDADAAPLGACACLPPRASR